MRKLRYWLSLSSLLLAGCADTDNTYCSLPAKFSFKPVSSMPQLYSSLNSMGEWCTIKLSNGKFLFTNLTGTGEATQTAITGYSGFYMGLCGFIAGLPNMPEVGADSPVVTAYDLACPNCYSQRTVTKPLTLQSGGYAHCAACDYTYNLNNLGIVTSTGANTYGFTVTRSLYRYRAFYGSDVFTINNNY